jgi:heptosyltransferase-1
MKILLIKTSSLGDVIHNLPVASDLDAHFPGAEIDWVVEESFADIPRLHPAIRCVIPVALRRWRKSLFARETWREMGDFRAAIRAETYDLVIDSQGLLKSALIARQAYGRRCGFAADSAREPVAARLYDSQFRVAKSNHAVERNRLLAAQAGGYTLTGSADYAIGRRVAQSAAPLNSSGTYAVLLTATSRDDKLWPEADWVALGRHLADRGLVCRLPAGNATERERAHRIAAAIPGAEVMPPMSLRELAEWMGAAKLVVGVDTGLVHLAAALGRPTVALFCASDPALTGVHAGEIAINLGIRNQPPALATVIAATTALC